jgi:hypothetical protein
LFVSPLSVSLTSHPARFEGHQSDAQSDRELLVAMGETQGETRSFEIDEKQHLPRRHGGTEENKKNRLPQMNADQTQNSKTNISGWICTNLRPMILFSVHQSWPTGSSLMIGFGPSDLGRWMAPRYGAAPGS